MKNYIGQTFGLSALVALLLILLSLWEKLPSIGGISFKTMDIFASVRRAAPVAVDSSEWTDIPSDSFAMPDTAAYGYPTDSIADVPFGPLPPVDSFYFGKSIEDYTQQQTGLTTFFAAIDSIRSHQQTVRIAFFGDSFVEGDILLGDLRDTFQSVWGGRGVGYVPITSEVARFKRTLEHQYTGWNTQSIVKSDGNHPPFGVNGFVYLPKDNASVRYAGTPYFKNTRQWSTLRLFYQSPVSRVAVWKGNDREEAGFPLPATGGRAGQAALQKPGLQSVNLRFPFTDSLWVYGASLEDGPGIYLDNFSVRGNTGGKLRKIDASVARQFDRMLQYDLIIVQLGLNAVTPNLDNIKWYRRELEQTFEHLQACFPGKPIVVFSVADRAGKINGELVTMPSVMAIANMQRELARRYGFLFFDLYHAMGGAGSMIRLSEHKPALANKDYTHLTHAGGRVVGHRIADIFFDAYATYKNQHQ
jgi:lysophospholipase L1-like esterase